MLCFKMVDVLTWIRQLAAQLRRSRPEAKGHDSRMESKRGESCTDVDVDTLGKDLEKLGCAVKLSAQADQELLAVRSAQRRAEGKDAIDQPPTDQDYFSYYIEYDDRSSSSSVKPSPRVIIHYQVPAEW